MSWKLTVMWEDGWQGPMRFHDLTRVTLHEDTLEQIARRRGVRTLVEMGAADGVYDPTDAEYDEDEEDEAANLFFSPEEGLTTLSAVAKELRESPSLISDPDDCEAVLMEIAELEKQLRAGLDHKKGFRFLNV